MPTDIKSLLQRVDHQSPHPLRMQIEDILRKAIIDGSIAEGSKLPTVRNIARDCNIGKSTVANAFDTLTNEGLLVARPYKGTTVAPRNTIFRKENTKRIGLVFEGLSVNGSPYSVNIIKAATMVIEESGYVLDVLPVEINMMPAEKTVYPALESGKLAGIIYFLGYEPDMKVIKRIQRARLPVVAIDYYAIPLGYDSVVIDNRRIFKETTASLIADGHRRIAYIGSSAAPQPNNSVSERMIGFRSAMKGSGLAISENLIRQEYNSVIGGQIAMRAIFDSPEESPTAVVTFSDYLAMGAIFESRERGLVIPDDISIIGFGNEAEDLALYSGLSTYKIDESAIGETAASTLIKRIDGFDDEPQLFMIGAEKCFGKTSLTAK